MALTLRLLGGLTTEEIARAFLVPEPTIAQRIVRAKRTLAEKRVPFEVPRGEELAARLSSVLEVLTWSSTKATRPPAGDDWMRPALCEDALRLGRILAELAPGEPEVHGLVALMEIQASRREARVGPSGETDPTAGSESGAVGSPADPAWSGGAGSCGKTRHGRGPYALQAAIAACHARARDGGGDGLAAHRGAVCASSRGLMPSPVVELNRAVAVGMAFGPQAGLEIGGSRWLRSRSFETLSSAA